MSQVKHAWKDPVAGTIGGAALVVAGYPLDTVKVKMQTMPRPQPGQSPLYGSAMDCLRKTVRAEGLRGLYRGMVSPLTGVPPVYAVVFGAYGNIKQALLRFRGQQPGELLSLPDIFWAGCLTGVATTPITVPVELVKVRMQVSQAAAGGKPQYASSLDAARKILAAEGIRSLFRGTVATLWRDVPGSGAYFVANEAVKRAAIPEGGTINDVGALPLLIGGGMAGVANWLTIFPIDLIKSRVQAAPPGTFADGHRGMWQCARQVVAEGGVAGLFKGIGPTLLRSFPANAVCFFTVDMMMRVFNYSFP